MGTDISTSDCHSISHDAVPEVLPHQAEACKGSEAEPPHPPVDPPEDKQHHQVQCQEEALAQDSSRHLDDSPTHPHFRRSIPASKHTPVYTTISTHTSAITQIDFESQ